MQTEASDRHSCWLWLDSTFQYNCNLKRSRTNLGTSHGQNASLFPGGHSPCLGIHSGGLIFSLLYILMVEDRLGFVDQAQRAQGSVSAVNVGGSHPQIDFTDATGRVVSHLKNGLIFGYAIGDQVEVLYRPEAPATTAIIDDRGALWGASLLAGLFALVFALGASYHLVAWMYRRRMAQSA